MKKQSQNLTNFYREYLKWVESGAPETPAYKITEEIIFCRGAGLCYNLMIWRQIETLRLEMSDQLFDELGVGSSGTPFNNSAEDYIAEVNLGNCHLNVRRIQWVKDHLTEEYV